MGEHARLSASGAAKWLACPMSLWMEDEIPDEGSVFAEEGTKAHALAELMIKRMLVKEKLSGVEFNQQLNRLEPIPKEMAEYITGFVDFVGERYQEIRRQTPDALLLSEARLDYSCWAPEGFGTGDIILLADHYMEIIDLKYGKGVKVSADDNSQLKLYALGAINEYEHLYDIETVQVTIYQPRLDHIASCRYQAEELKTWGYSTVLPQARKALYGTGDCRAGNHCDTGFCRARPICRAYTTRRMQPVKFDYARPHLLQPEEIAEVLDIADRLTNWSKMVKAHALDQILQGGKIPGFKAVEGRSIHSYADEERVLQKLIHSGFAPDDIAVTRPLGITDMEKKLGKTQFAELLGDLVIKPAGAPTLAPVSDRRPAINTLQQAIDDFKDITGGTQHE